VQKRKIEKEVYFQCRCQSGICCCW